MNTLRPAGYMRLLAVHTDPVPDAIDTGEFIAGGSELAASRATRLLFVSSWPDVIGEVE
jgi:hypothetical protein